MTAKTQPIFWTQTYSGVKWDLLNPKAEDVNFIDIAEALGKLCRFNGHTQKFYSVAEHCCHAYDVALALHPDDKQLHLAALLHDAHEAYIGDMTTPVANLLTRLPGFKEVWSLVKLTHDIAIFSAAGVDFALGGRDTRSARLTHEVKQIDLALLMAERDQILGSPPDTWGVLEDVDFADVEIEGWLPASAALRFTSRLALARRALDLDLDLDW